ncbi:GSCOCG00008284001-RA-CDS [Cotesia congregata]|uniref:protein-serine/threonine phosphatase n=1 Tax=Cotesia congregata TaxID=51543 RepID=A0A8J2MQD5_COTCN|nr:GSCOCG00008284001-RA-CDS [Cotesia congregata]CAG5089698.1 Similar to CG10417: Probable protein phosphatase CG10417 (Drosophila melanogaster) [Cotesia congregata]
MGAYLSEPVTTKESVDGLGKNVVFGASSMQGWRISQEDAHNCCSDFDENVSLFAVYDGHGGHEVASYCAKKLPDFIKETEAYKRGDIRQALIDAFLGFDATLATPEVIKVLKEISSSAGDSEKVKEEAETDEEDNVRDLKQEAAMPLEQVIAKYMETPAGDRLGKKIISSPNIRCRRTKERDPAAGCSSTWTNEADVSSSSVSASASGESKEKEKDGEAEKCPEKDVESCKSSEAEQILDSTTGTGTEATVNGEVDHKVVNEPAVKAKEEIKEIKAEMPDSSEDSDAKVSPSKNETESKEVNGSDVKDKPESKEEAKNNDVTSSSTMENGETSQEAMTSTRRRISAAAEALFHGLLGDSDSDEEDEDDTDESFDAPGESDEEELDQNESDEEDSDDEYAEYEDDENDDAQEDITMDEEPGSDSGCTAVVAILRGDDLFVANAGDSRCVLCRDGQALELSLDHKPEDDLEMKRINEAGGKVTADGRVNGGLNLSRALGDHSYKQNSDLPPEKQMISAMPDVRHVKIETQRDEFLILACDGIWNFMSSADVVEFVKKRIDERKQLSAICEELFDHCLAPDTCGDGTGCDNMTAVIVKLKNDTEDQKNKTEESAAKKRPLSPTSEKNSANEQSNECKRARETV